MNNYYKTEVFAVVGSPNVAGLVTGYRGKISRYTTAINSLKALGYSVVIYEFNPDVITKGNPRDLLDAIDKLTADFAAKTKDAADVIVGGVSFGAGMAMCLQRTVPKVRYGVYGVAGVSPSDSIFDMPIFYFVRRRFIRNGYSPEALRNIWQEHEIRGAQPPRSNSPIVMALGRRDRVVRYADAVATLTAWQEAGVPVEIITKPRLGHLATIRWYKKHISEIVQIAEKLTVSTGKKK